MARVKQLPNSTIMDFAAACANDYEYALALQQEEDRRGAAAARARTSSGVHTGGGAASAAASSGAHNGRATTGASMPASSSSRAHVAAGEWYTEEEEDEEYGGTADDRAIAEALQQQLASFPDQRTASEQRDYQLALMLQAAEAAQLQGSTSTPASTSRGRKRGAPLGDTSAGAGSHKQQRRAASSHASGSRHAPATASPHASGDGPGTPSCVYVESEVAGGPPAPPRGNLAFQLLKLEELRAGVRGEDTTSSNKPSVAIRLTDLVRPGIEYVVAAVLTVVGLLTTCCFASTAVRVVSHVTLHIHTWQVCVRDAVCHKVELPSCSMPPPLGVQRRRVGIWWQCRGQCAPCTMATPP